MFFNNSNDDPEMIFDTTLEKNTVDGKYTTGRSLIQKLFDFVHEGSINIMNTDRENMNLAQKEYDPNVFIGKKMDLRR